MEKLAGLSSCSGLAETRGEYAKWKRERLLSGVLYSLLEILDSTSIVQLKKKSL